MKNKSSEYILGTSDEELARLGYQHQVWLDEAAWLWERAAFGQGNRILDLGSGPGFATLDLARLVSLNGKITAVDNSEKFIAYLEQQIRAANLQNVETRLGDVQQLELPEDYFDGAFARWLLCFVPEPEKVIAVVARALKPGGRFVVMDYYNYQSIRIYPHRLSIEKIFVAYYESVQMAGGNYDVAGILPEMMTRNGFEIETIKPINRVARAHTRIWKWVELFNQSYLPKLVESGLLSESEVSKFHRDWAQLNQEPAAFLYAPPMLGIIGIKE